MKKKEKNGKVPLTYLCHKPLLHLHRTKKIIIMQNIKYLICITFSFLLMSCGEDFFDSITEIEVPEHEPQLVIRANFNPTFGEKYGYYVQLNHTLGILDTAAYKVVEDATVTLLEDNEIKATFETSGSRSNGWYSSVATTLLTEKNYTLKAVSPTYGSIESTQQLPNKIQIIAATYEADAAVDRYGDRGDEVTIQFQDPSGEENYYRINMLNFSIEILADYNETLNANPFYVDKDKIIYIREEPSGTGKTGINIFQYTINTNTWSSRFENTGIKVTRVFYNNSGKTYFLEGVYSAIRYIYSFDGTTFKKTDLELPAGFKDYFSEKIFDDNKFYFVESSGRANNTNRIMVLDLTTNKFTEYTNFLFDDIDFLNSFKIDNFIYLESIDIYNNYKRKLYKLDLNKL